MFLAHTHIYGCSLSIARYANTVICILTGSACCLFIADWLYGALGHPVAAPHGFEDDADFDDDDYDDDGGDSNACFNESAIAAFHNGETLLVPSGAAKWRPTTQSKLARNRASRAHKPHSLAKNKPRALGRFECPRCLKGYTAKGSRDRHVRYECGREPRLQCTFCPHRTFYQSDLKKHMQHKHESELVH